MPLNPASGTGKFYARSAKMIRFLRQGCANRPFFHVVVTQRKHSIHQPVIEQLGTYDPMANKYNEKLVALNMERIKYWIGKGAHISRPTAEIFGISGFLPVHPKTYMLAWRNRLAQQKAKAEQEAKDSEDATATQNA